MIYRVRINEDSKRAADFMKVFGRLEVPIETPIPDYVDLPGFDKPQLVYKLDLVAITADERDALIDHLADRFSLARLEVQQGLLARGVPILTSESVLIITRVTGPHHD